MSLARIAASAAVFTLLSAGCAAAKPIATTAETNFRKSPGTDSPVLSIIPKGTTVKVGSSVKGWCETSVDGRDGDVIARNLGLAPARRARPAQVYDEEVVEEVGPPRRSADLLLLPRGILRLRAVLWVLWGMGRLALVSQRTRVGRALDAGG